jgi:2-polyprenyl-3-methyl-5-hydroxy-6-metoxy-1,4-benzoquinol methylase
MNLTSVVDQPTPGSSQYRQRIPVEGWIYGDYRHERLKRVSAHAPTGEIGSTSHFYLRSDVNESLHLAPDTRTGFRFLATFPTPPSPSASLSLTLGIEIRAEFTDGTVVPLAGIHIKLLANDFTGAPYGNLCNPQKSGLLYRKHLYSTGHPAETASPECVALLADYLAPGASVLDVGCGVGAYCDPLHKRGHTWIGCETSPDCLHGLALHSRPHRAIKLPRWPWSRYRIPAADREFDAAIAIEVLEHIREPAPFLAEIARVTRHHAFFSVPNLETLPFLSDRLVAPWHLLEGDHFNFFTRFNLRPLLESHFRSVELLDYGRQPLASPDGLPLPYHLFAICEV